VSTLHEQLLASIDETERNTGGTGGWGDALRAVVELHRPEPYSTHNPIAAAYLVCHGCDMDGYEAEHPEWPCSTIRTIAEALGVPLEAEDRG
jgi:hypothetical protein